MPPEVSLFLSLDKADRIDALQVAASVTSRPAHLLEKDVWVVWTLNELFSAPFGKHLVFKGGTSLSKAYDIIDRFSEDIDLTYDVTALISELAISGELPSSASQARKWTKAVQRALPDWVETQALPLIQGALARDGLEAKLTIADSNLSIEFEPAIEGTGYVKPVVEAEFGGRSTGLPANEVDIQCDAAPSLPELLFPTASVRAMSPARTFWEKATAIHVYCLRGKFRGRKSFARHWHDLQRLHVHGYAETAINDRELATAVAEHKTLFFAEKDSNGQPIDYVQAVGRHLRLVPTGDPLDRLKEDYEAMIADGLIHYEATPFDTLVTNMESIESLANDQNRAPTEEPSAR